MKISLTDEQKVVLRAILQWYVTREKPFITLGGFAGTGKTTITALLRKIIHDKKPSFSVAFCAYTGKASRVLANKLVEEGIQLPQDSVSTIHGLIYQTQTDKDGRIVGWHKKPTMKYDLIIVDEASMLNYQLWQDLLSFGIPILAVGDHGQLPPVEGSFNLMNNPELRLERIHRQAADNPIIQLSMEVRNTGKIQVGKFGAGVIKYDRADPLIFEIIQTQLQQLDDDTLLLTGSNKTRIQLNKEVRQLQMRETEEPEVGDKVICVKNNWEKHIYNGMVGTIRHIKNGFAEDGESLWYEVEIEMNDQNMLYIGKIWKGQFNALSTLKDIPKLPNKETIDLFDFGYALTVHKAQGSQAKKVIVFEERFQKMDEEMWRRWLYTAITRAENELYIIGDNYDI